MYEQLPKELKSLRQWVCWKAVPDESRPGRIKKIPINPKTGGQAMSNNPDTWTDFASSVSASRNFSGIGFMFAGGYFGVDLDDCRGEIEEYQAGLAGASNNLVAEFVHGLGSYAEYSVSGEGVHIICRGKLPPAGRRRGTVEMYEDGRFFIMTGNPVCEYRQIAECTQAIKPLHEKYIGAGMAPGAPLTHRESSGTPALLTDSQLIDLAKASKQGQTFTNLLNGQFDSYYPSQSEADMAFCAMLAFWTRRNPEQMDRIFRASGLMRPKWDRRQSGTTYGALTLKRACDNCLNVYDPTPKEDYVITIGSGPEKPKKRVYTFDDTGNAKRLFDTFGAMIRYCYVDKKWLYYDGRRWTVDLTGEIKRMCDRVISEIGDDLEFYMENIPEGIIPEDYEKAFLKHLKSCRASKSKTAMIKETEHLAPILPAQLDTHTDLLNTPGGIVNLRTGELTPHDPEKYISRITHAEYTDKVDCPKWEEFLEDIFDGDLEMIRYIQKAVGYSISGSMQEQCAFFLFGMGKNGKSTFTDVLASILGDYAMNMQAETLMVKQRSGGGPSGDIARLKGARFVTSAEPNEGVRLDEGMVKQITGGDRVTARKMYGEDFEFAPEFKLWMGTNHKPVIRGTDLGIWRRIHLIPFTVQIPEEKRDPYLKYKLLREASGILKWAVDGCLLWKKEGLQMPAAVRDAVKEYKGEMDVVGAFLEDCAQEGPGQISASKLFQAYVQWAKSNNEYCMSGTKFGKEVSKRYKKVRLSSGQFYLGLKLLEEAFPYQVSFYNN